ncbi:MAG TPA: OmpA family protein [Gemmatimonadales bacterium]|jgi:outer membrane protein OmpA-like peptidoglycan-associated protein|nr:OmpA family protein [Gemmatimonadales bacterium]
MKRALVGAVALLDAAPLAALWLSRQRAERVKAFLVSRGVDPRRMTVRGYGAARPIGSNATAAGRAQNRRVELRRTD